jgi:hypothetical protein
MRLFTAAKFQDVVFWIISACILVGGYQSFGGAWQTTLFSDGERLRHQIPSKSHVSNIHFKLYNPTENLVRSYLLIGSGTKQMTLSGNVLELY